MSTGRAWLELLLLIGVIVVPVIAIVVLADPEQQLEYLQEIGDDMVEHPHPPQDSPPHRKAAVVHDALVARLCAWATAIPDTPGPLGQARERVVGAFGLVEAAVRIDPTLPDRQQRDLDLFTELLRQLKPLAKQAALALERQRLHEAGDVDQAAVARLGKINNFALPELEVLSQRTVTVAEEFAGFAWPDWDTPTRILQRSHDLLPDDGELEAIARKLRAAVQPSLSLAHPAPEAVRLAALADKIAPRPVDQDRIHRSN